MNNIHFTNTSDVRIVDSTAWCTANGCLRVFGKIIFSIDCPLSCQSRKMNQLDTLNLIEPSIKINLNSTMNISYIIELDGFTIGKKWVLF